MEVGDVKRTFKLKLLPIHPSLQPSHGINLRGKYYFCVILVFGSRCSRKGFYMLSQAIC